MTPQAADWVYEHVLVGWEWHGNSSDRPPHILRHCRCQGGICGHCWAGQHAQCTTRTLGPNPGPETYLFPLGDGEHTAVWLSGTPCAWRCACGCPSAEPQVAVEASGEPLGQLELFALAGGTR